MDRLFVYGTLRSQFTNAGEHMRQITGGVMSAVKGETKEKP